MLPVIEVLTDLEIQAFLKTVSLPPNMCIMFEYERKITVASAWPNVHRPTETVPVSLTLPVDPYLNLTRDGLRSLVEMMVQQCWIHELNEWFKIDDEYVKDPHPIPQKVSVR